MKEEFNLSEKRQDTNKGTDFIRYAYCEEDVKEFIRLLKENLRNWDKIDEGYFLEVIDKLAGNKLVDSESERPKTKEGEK